MPAVLNKRLTTATFLTAAASAVGAAMIAVAPAHASQFDRNDPLCRTPHGRLAQIKNNPGSLHRAYAAMRNGGPVIVFNPRRMAQLSPITRIWVYYHECAHHALGHTVGNRVVTRENDADCWAIRAMRYRGLLTAARYRLIKADMHRVYRRGGPVHLPGHLRAEHLDLCLKTTGYGRIRNAKFTPLILRRKMAMRHGRRRPHADPRGNGWTQPYGQRNGRPNGRRGEPEPAPNQIHSFNERRQLEEN